MANKYCSLTDQIDAARKFLGGDAVVGTNEGAFTAQSADGKISVAALGEAIGVVVKNNHPTVAVMFKTSYGITGKAVSDKIDAPGIAQRFVDFSRQKDCDFGEP